MNGLVLVGIACLTLLISGCADAPAKEEAVVEPAKTTTRPTTAPAPSSSENPLSFTEALPTIPDLPGPSAPAVLVVMLLALGVALARRRDGSR